MAVTLPSGRVATESSLRSGLFALVRVKATRFPSGAMLQSRTFSPRRTGGRMPSTAATSSPPPAAARRCTTSHLPSGVNCAVETSVATLRAALPASRRATRRTPASTKAKASATGLTVTNETAFPRSSGSAPGARESVRSVPESFAALYASTKKSHLLSGL
jgi:hypothetical protein